MLSRKSAGALAGAAFLIVMSGHVQARGNAAVESVCQQMREEINFYYERYSQGGTAKQMEVWKRMYRKYIWKYGKSNCKTYRPQRGGNVALSKPPERPAS